MYEASVALLRTRQILFRVGIPFFYISLRVMFSYVCAYVFSFAYWS